MPVDYLIVTQRWSDVLLLIADYTKGLYGWRSNHSGATIEKIIHLVHPIR